MLLRCKRERVTGRFRKFRDFELHTLHCAKRHLHAALKLNTSLHQASLRTDCRIWTTKFWSLPILIYIYIACIILTVNIIIFNCYGVTATQITKFVILYINNKITMKMATIAAEICWWEFSKKIQYQYRSAFYWLFIYYGLLVWFKIGCEWSEHFSCGEKRRIFRSDISRLKILNIDKKIILHDDKGLRSQIISYWTFTSRSYLQRKCAFLK